MSNDAIKVKKTEDIIIEDLPLGKIKWNKFSDFALTFDFKNEDLNDQELKEVGDAKPNSGQNIKVLRAILYQWQRIWNGQHEQPPEEFFVEVREILDWIRFKLTSGGE